MGWTVWVLNPGRGKRCFFFLKRPEQLLNLQRSHSVETDTLSSAKKGRWCVKLTTHLDLALKSRISGAILLLHLYVCVAWTEKTSPLWEY